MFEFIIDFYFSNASSNSLNTLQAVAVETPLWSSMGASSLTSAPTMFAFVTGADGLQKLQKADAARFGRACAGEGRRVKAVQINCQIDRHIGLAQPVGQLGQTGEVELVHIGVPCGKLKLFPIAAADAELVDAPVANQIVAAA